MTTAAPTSIPQVTPSTNSSAPSAHSRTASVSGQASSSAAVPASAPTRSYAIAAAPKKLNTPAIVASNVNQVAGGTSGQHARHTSTASTPVNGSRVVPAVPAILNSGNAIANGANKAFSGGSHSRKSSQSVPGAPMMPNGAPRPPNVSFGGFNEACNPSGTQSGPAVAATNSSLTAPMAPNPRVNSPQPAPVVSQASGGLPQTSAPGAIQFGDATHQQQSRPVSMPPTGPNSHGQGHSRRDSTQSAHADTAPAHVGHSARGMPSGNRGGRTYNNQNQYSQNQQYNNNTYARGYANNSNQQRPPAMGIPNYQASGHMPSYQSSPRNQHRSPHLAHASPSMASAQMAPTQLYPAQYMTNQPHYQMPYDPNYFPQPFYQLPQGYGVMQTSPRPAYTQIAQTVQGPYIPQQYGTSMSRSPSANISDLHVRPNSSMGQLPTPSLAPQSVAVPPQPPGTPGPQNPYSSRKPAGKGIEIKNPATGAKVEFKPSSKPPTSNTPVIVSSPSPAPGNRAPSRDANHSRDASKSGKSEQEKRDEMRASVAKKVLDDAKKEAAERKQKEEELAEKAEEERMKREKEASEELKRKEEEAMKLQKEAEEEARQEAEKKARKEEEERKRKEEEEAAEAARLAKEKADEEQARIAKEKAEEEARIQAENEKKAQEEEEEEAIKLKAEEDAKIAAEAKAEEEKAASLLAPVSKPSTPDSESMPPPPLKGAEKRSKPSPLNLQIKTNEPAPPSAALTALRSARFIENLNGVNYPSNISSPNPALNPAASGKFKYEKDFLMQFQSVFTEKPSVDWDQKMKDTVGDTDSARPSTARTPSGLGPRGSNRGGLPQSNNPPMGAFGSAFKPLGPQMQTSAQRFEQSQRAQTTPGNALPGLAGSNFSRQGLIRTASSTSLSSSNAAPQSPRIQNRSARGSKRGGAGTPMERSDSRQAERSQPTIPLGDVKPLPVSENRWKPRSVGAVKAVEAPAIIPTPSEDNRLSPELVQRKVKSNLNKMTPEKFDKISDQILEITSQSKFETDGRTLRQVIQLTFEKATDEAAWSSMYAKFCKRMLETMDPSIKDENIRDKNDNIVTGGNLFRKYLLNRCQEEFERGWKVQAGKEDVILSDEYYINAAAKRRGLGLVQFIGELFKLGMLTERIMNECVRKLLDFEGVPEDETVESLVKLLKTIGGQLDGSTKSKSMMDMYFARINSMTEHKELNSRMKFMLMDIVDLRRKGWATKEADKGPKTMQEVRDEAMKAQQEKEAISRANQRSGRSGGGRGDGRSFSNNFGGGGGGMQPPGGYDNKGGLVDPADFKKLGAGARSKMSSQGPSTFGPSSMFTRNASSGGSRRGFGSARGDDSGPSSRTATPPAPAATSHANPYSLLGGDSGDTNDTASPPPSTASSPPVTNAKLDRARTPQPSQD